MEKTEVTRKLTEIFQTVLKDDRLVLEDRMTANDVDKWDSLSHVLLITDIEESFGIKFKLKELNRMRNVGEMINLIISKLSE
jgi:acyl carrier protein